MPTLRLQTSDPRENILSAHDDGRPIYHITTPPSLFDHCTTAIRRIDQKVEPDGQQYLGPVVATVEWHNGTVQWKDQSIPFRSYFTRTSKTRFGYSFKGTDGRTYEWTLVDGHRLTLYEGLDQKLTVARLLSSQSGVFKVKRKIALEIMDGIAKQEMDQIVLTFVVIMAQDAKTHRACRGSNAKDLGGIDAQKSEWF